MKFVIIIIVCVLWLWTWGALMADLNSGWTAKIYNDNERQEHYRRDLAVTCFLALLPVFWVLSPFITGFYQHGWRLKMQERK